MNTYEIVQYYKDLLILQYNGKPKAAETIETSVTPFVMPQTTVQTISFSNSAASGTMVLSWDSNPSASINWNDSASSIQTKIRAVPGLSAVIVTGSIAARLLTVTFTGVTPPAKPLVLVSSSIEDSFSDPVTITITETDVTIPVAVQEAFNVTAPEAVGVQLDVLGKYAGVSRTGQGFTAPITLDDANFATLIKMAIIENSSGSDLSTIVGLLYQFFPNEIFVIDNTDMTLDYVISTVVGSQDLIQLFIKEGLLPKPMGVRIKSIIYSPIINDYFGFSTYSAPAMHSTPFNSYAVYNTSWQWINYSNGIIV